MDFILVKGLLDNYGMPIAVIIGLSFLVWYIIKMHRSERQEWRQDINKQHEEILNITGQQHKENLDMTNKTNEIISKNTNAVSDIKTLLESIDRRT